MHGTVLLQNFEKSTKSSKIRVLCQRKQYLIDIQSETSPKSPRQITMQKQEFIKCLATCG